MFQFATATIRVRLENRNGFWSARSDELPSLLACRRDRDQLLSELPSLIKLLLEENEGKEDVLVSRVEPLAELLAHEIPRAADEAAATYESGLQREQFVVHAPRAA